MEELSLLTGTLDFGSEDAVELYQQASFLTANISFNFVGVGSMPTGDTSVDVIVDGETIASGTAALVDNGAKNLVYNTSFVLALPGGTVLSADDYIEVCDRRIPLAAVTLNANRNRNITRTIDFKPELGDPYWSDGTYGRVAHPSGVEVVGIIVFVNNYEDSDNSDLAVEARALTEKDSGFGHALVMSLRNAATSIRWGGTTKRYTTAVQDPGATLNIDNVSGYLNTKEQRNETAPQAALNYRSGDTHTGHDSGWFLPSVGQWMYSISTRGFGGADPAEDWLVADSKDKKWLTNGSIGNLVLVKKGDTNENLLVLSLNGRLETLRQHLGCGYDAFGMTIGSEYGDNYWTSTEYSATEAIRMNLGSMKKPTGSSDWYSTIKVGNLGKGKTWAYMEGFIMKVRPFLAF